MVLPVSSMFDVVVLWPRLPAPIWGDKFLFLLPLIPPRSFRILVPTIFLLRPRAPFIPACARVVEEAPFAREFE